MWPWRSKAYHKNPVGHQSSLYTASGPTLHHHANSPRTDLSQSTLLDSSISGSVIARPGSSCRKKARSSSVTQENGSRGGAALGRHLTSPAPPLIPRCCRHSVWQPKKTLSPFALSAAVVEETACEDNWKAYLKRSRLNRCNIVAIAEEMESEDITLVIRIQFHVQHYECYISGALGAL